MKISITLFSFVPSDEPVERGEGLPGAGDRVLLLHPLLDPLLPPQPSHQRLRGNGPLGGLCPLRPGGGSLFCAGPFPPQHFH